MTKKTDSPIPTDPFDQQMARLMGLPNGASTAPSVVQDVDFYGNVVSWMVQTLKHEQGETTFLTSVSAAGSSRFVLPPKVLQVIDRQRASTQTMVRRRHGQRLAETRVGLTPGFTPEMRAKAAATRRLNAEKRRKRREARS